MKNAKAIEASLRTIPAKNLILLQGTDKIKFRRKRTCCIGNGSLSSPPLTFFFPAPTLKGRQQNPRCGGVWRLQNLLVLPPTEDREKSLMSSRKPSCLSFWWLFFWGTDKRRIRGKGLCLLLKISFLRISFECYCRISQHCYKRLSLSLTATALVSGTESTITFVSQVWRSNGYFCFLCVCCHFLKTCFQPQLHMETEETNMVTPTTVTDASASFDTLNSVSIILSLGLGSWWYGPQSFCRCCQKADEANERKISYTSLIPLFFYMLGKLDEQLNLSRRRRYGYVPEKNGTNSDHRGAHFLYHCSPRRLLGQLVGSFSGHLEQANAEHYKLVDPQLGLGWHPIHRFLRALHGHRLRFSSWLALRRCLVSIGYKYLALESLQDLSSDAGFISHGSLILELLGSKLLFLTGKELRPHRRPS